MTEQAFKTRTFDQPDDQMTFPRGHADIVRAGTHRVLQITFEPGFRWSQDMAPIARTARCQLQHVFWVVSGQMGLQLEDGTEVSVGAGQLVSLAPNHDSWTIGEQPVTFLDIDPVATGT